LADDLKRFLDDEPIEARPSPRWREGVRWAKRRPVLATLLAASIVAVLGLLGGGLWHHTQLRAAHARTQQALEESQEQTLRLYIANGTRLMDDGDLFDASVWFAEAFQRAPQGGRREQMHRMRLGWVLGRSPQLQQLIFHDAAVRHAEFSNDGKK